MEMSDDDAKLLSEMLISLVPMASNRRRVFLATLLNGALLMEPTSELKEVTQLAAEIQTECRDVFLSSLGEQLRKQN